MVVSHVMGIDYDRAHYMRGDIAMIVFQFGKQLCHRTALAGATSENQDLLSSP